jgi:hypothetical protein
MENFLKAILIGLIIIAVIAIVFGAYWLMAKGLIWVMLELFKIDWTAKFWPVFILICLVSTVCGWIGKGKK